MGFVRALSTYMENVREQNSDAGDWRKQSFEIHSSYCQPDVNFRRKDQLKGYDRGNCRGIDKNRYKNVSGYLFGGSILEYSIETDCTGIWWELAELNSSERRSTFVTSRILKSGITSSGSHFVRYLLTRFIRKGFVEIASLPPSLSRSLTQSHARTRARARATDAWA